MPAKPHLRIVYDDLERLRTDVCALLESGGCDIDWDHIVGRGHDIQEPDVVKALRAGDYRSSRFPGRYPAEYFDEPKATDIRVVFEIWAGAEGEKVVVTAYPLEES